MLEGGGRLWTLPRMGRLGGCYRGKGHFVDWGPGLRRSEKGGEMGLAGANRSSTVPPKISLGGHKKDRRSRPNDNKIKDFSCFRFGSSVLLSKLLDFRAWIDRFRTLHCST